MTAHGSDEPVRQAVHLAMVMFTRPSRFLPWWQAAILIVRAM